MNNISEKLVRNSTESLALAHLDRSGRISARELHKYVVGLVGVFGLFIITYPIAIHRVAQTEKFAPDRSHLKSLTLEYQALLN
jgi:hypothetical protein